MDKSSLSQTYTWGRAELAVGDRITVHHRADYADYMGIKHSEAGTILAVDEHGLFLRVNKQTSSSIPWWLVVRVEGEA